MEKCLYGISSSFTCPFSLLLYHSKLSVICPLLCIKHTLADLYQQRRSSPILSNMLAYLQIGILSILFILTVSVNRRIGVAIKADCRHWWVLSSFLLILAICLLFCLIIFLKQVHWHAENIMEADFLWPYHLNWWCDLFYILAGESFSCLMLKEWRENLFTSWKEGSV